MKTILKILPFLTSILIGLIFYLIGIRLESNVNSFLIGISSAFFAIPLIYLFYQVVYNFSHKKLNKAIIDYTKVQIDREVLSIINQSHKIIFSYKEKDFSPEGINKFLSLSKEEIKEIIAKNEYLGFQIFKKWRASENNIENILKNPFILQKLEDEQIISIISMIQSLKSLEDCFKINDLYIKTDKKTVLYKIVSSKEFNEEENIKFPERYLLLKKINENKFTVEDFGDFSLYDVDKLLQKFKLNGKYLENFAEIIISLIKEINNWCDLTNREFIIDTRMFRLPNRF